MSFELTYLNQASKSRILKFLTEDRPIARLTDPLIVTIKLKASGLKNLTLTLIISEIYGHFKIVYVFFLNEEI